MSLRPRARSPREQGGFVATELALGVGVLLLPAVVVVLTIPSWSERQTTGRAIAREVGRAVASDGRCDTALANGLARIMARNLGLPDTELDVALDCTPGTALVPGSDVQVSVTVRMPAVHLPALGGVAGWSWTARHREPVDRYGATR